MKYYKVKEIAKMFEVSEQAVYKWIKEGKINYVDLAGTYRIRQIDLDEFIKVKN